MIDEDELIEAAQETLQWMADNWNWTGVVGNTHCIVAIRRLEEMKREKLIEEEDKERVS